MAHKNTNKIEVFLCNLRIKAFLLNALESTIYTELTTKRLNPICQDYHWQIADSRWCKK